MSLKSLLLGSSFLLSYMLTDHHNDVSNLIFEQFSFQFFKVSLLAKPKEAQLAVNTEHSTESSRQWTKKMMT